MSPHTYLPTSPPGAIFVKKAILFGRKAAIFFSRSFDFGLSHVTSVSISAIIFIFSKTYTKSEATHNLSKAVFRVQSTAAPIYLWYSWPCDTIAVQA